jgi:hypothetical protein
VERGTVQRVCVHMFMLLSMVLLYFYLHILKTCQDTLHEETSMAFALVMDEYKTVSSNPPIMRCVSYHLVSNLVKHYRLSCAKLAAAATVKPYHGLLFAALNESVAP